MDFFDKKNSVFQKTDKGSQFAVECDWIRKISQYVQVLVFPKRNR